MLANCSVIEIYSSALKNNYFLFKKWHFLDLHITLLHNCLPACMCIMGVLVPLESRKGRLSPLDCTYRGSWTTMDAGNQIQVSGESNKCFFTDPDLQTLNNYFQIFFLFLLNHVSVWTFLKRSSLASWEKWSKVRCLLSFCVEIFVLQFYMRKRNAKCCLWNLYSQLHSSFYLGKMKSESVLEALSIWHLMSFSK